MARLDTERQERLEPKRIAVARQKLTELGYDVSSPDDKSLAFMHDGHIVTYWPYSGWASGKSITDGRGLNNLLKQLTTLGTSENTTE